MGLTQPRLNDRLRGRINNFSRDSLTLRAAQAGLELRMHITQAAAAAAA